MEHICQCWCVRSCSEYGLLQLKPVRPSNPGVGAIKGNPDLYPEARRTDDEHVRKKLNDVLDELNPETPDGAIAKEHARLSELQKDTHWIRRDEAENKSFMDAKFLCGETYIIPSILKGFKPIRSLIEKADGHPTCKRCLSEVESKGFKLKDIH